MANRIPKDFLPANTAQTYSDVYNTITEVIGFKSGKTLIEKLKATKNYKTDYPTSDKAIEMIISIQDNLKHINENTQPGLYTTTVPPTP